MKKFLALLMAAVMVLSICSAALAEEISVENAKDVWAEKWADVDTSKHVVINYMTTGDAPTTGANAEMLAELNKILTALFTFDNFRDQQEHHICVDEAFRADGLNRVLYKCPCCQAEGKMEGKK